MRLTDVVARIIQGLGAYLFLAALLLSWIAMASGFRARPVVLAAVTGATALALMTFGHFLGGDRLRTRAARAALAARPATAIAAHGGGVAHVAGRVRVLRPIDGDAAVGARFRRVALDDSGLMREDEDRGRFAIEDDSGVAIVDAGRCVVWSAEGPADAHAFAFAAEEGATVHVVGPCRWADADDIPALGPRSFRSSTRRALVFEGTVADPVWILV